MISLYKLFGHSIYINLLKGIIPSDELICCSISLYKKEKLDQPKSESDSEPDSGSDSELDELEELDLESIKESISNHFSQQTDPISKCKVEDILSQAPILFTDMTTQLSIYSRKNREKLSDYLLDEYTCSFNNKETFNCEDCYELLCDFHSKEWNNDQFSWEYDKAEIRSSLLQLLSIFKYHYKFDWIDIDLDTFPSMDSPSIVLKNLTDDSFVSNVLDSIISDIIEQGERAELSEKDDEDNNKDETKKVSDEQFLSIKDSEWISRIIDSAIYFYCDADAEEDPYGGGWSYVNIYLVDTESISLCKEDIIKIYKMKAKELVESNPIDNNYYF